MVVSVWTLSTTVFWRVDMMHGSVLSLCFHAVPANIDVEPTSNLIQTDFKLMSKPCLAASVWGQWVPFEYAVWDRSGLPPTCLQARGAIASPEVSGDSWDLLKSKSVGAPF